MFSTQGGIKDYLRRKQLEDEAEDSDFVPLAKNVGTGIGIGFLGGISAAMWHNVGVVDREAVRAGWTRGPAYRAVGRYGVLMGGILGATGLAYGGSKLVLDDVIGKDSRYTTAFLQGLIGGLPFAFYARKNNAAVAAATFGLALVNTTLHFIEDMPKVRERQQRTYGFAPGNQVPVQDLWKKERDARIAAAPAPSAH